MDLKKQSVSLQGIVEVVINNSVPQKTGDFLANWVTIIFPRKTMHPAVTQGLLLVQSTHFCRKYVLHSCFYPIGLSLRSLQFLGATFTLHTPPSEQAVTKNLRRIMLQFKCVIFQKIISSRQLSNLFHLEISFFCITCIFLLSKAMVLNRLSMDQSVT